jgi:hypothetical protein
MFHNFIEFDKKITHSDITEDGKKKRGPHSLSEAVPCEADPLANYQIKPAQFSQVSNVVTILICRIPMRSIPNRSITVELAVTIPLSNKSALWPFSGTFIISEPTVDVNGKLCSDTFLPPYTRYTIH